MHDVSTLRACYIFEFEINVMYGKNRNEVYPKQIRN
jgi:hypothetical protein